MKRMKYWELPDCGICNRKVSTGSNKTGIWVCFSCEMRLFHP